MLVLSRKMGEQVFVGSDVVIKILQISGGRVRVGITAPRTTPVHREEICPPRLSEVGFGEGHARLPK